MILWDTLPKSNSYLQKGNQAMRIYSEGMENGLADETFLSTPGRRGPWNSKTIAEMYRKNSAGGKPKSTM
jgi:hypothetical protein